MELPKTDRRDELIADEKRIQSTCNYDANPDPSKPKYFCTFPYQYQNGTSHLGHAYTILKDDYNARFMRLNGYNVLFPIGFHGTGMPIVACANKLKESLVKYGNLDQLDINSIPKNDQIRILYNMNIKKEDIPKFTDPYFWLTYFPQRGVIDLTRFGIAADFRRSFVTTDMNPYYDSFIKWQFEILKSNYLQFGKKPLIFSPKDGQPCADHDRTEQGEGVEVKEYNVFTVEYTDNENIVLTVPSEMKTMPEIMKFIVVLPTEEFVKYQIDGKVCIARKEYIRNLKYQTNSDITEILSFVGADLIGKNVIFNGKVIQIQKSNTDAIIPGSGFKIIVDKDANEDSKSIEFNYKYYEPERPVTSRTGDQCVAALVDQWFIDYSSQHLKKRVNDYIMSDKFNAYGDEIKKMLIDTSNWLTFWPCSRTVGLGTKLLDTEYLIDSLSDSTIYMAYYTVAHKITLIPINIIKSCGYEIWEYIFRNGIMPDIGYDVLLDEMKKEFQYWYPVDIRVSGKDLVGNHLVMCLYNHAMIWDDDKYFPRSYYVNGHVLLNGEKMSKSTGNFLTLEDAINKYGTDATRLALAEAGTGINDANFTNENANSAILKLFIEKEWCMAILDEMKNWNYSDTNTLTVWDDIFESEINQCFIEIEHHYKALDYQKVIVAIVKLQSVRDNYRTKYKSKTIRPSKKHLELYIERFLLAFYPICPHFVMSIWEKNKMSQEWPKNIQVNKEFLYMKDIFDTIVSEIRSAVSNMNKRYMKKGIKDAKFVVHVTYFTDFMELENQILDIIIKKDNILDIVPKDNKKMISSVLQFSRYLDTKIGRFGVECIKMDYNKIFVMLNDWLNILCKDKNIETIIITNQFGGERIIFQHNPFNPIIVVKQ